MVMLVDTLVLLTMAKCSMKNIITMDTTNTILLVLMLVRLTVDNKEYTIIPIVYGH